MTLRWIAALFAVCAFCVHAGEMDDAKAIGDEFMVAFNHGDFDALEAIYARANARKERSASGVFISNRMVRTMFRQEQSGESVEKGSDAYWDAAEKKAKEWVVLRPNSVLAAIALSQAYLGHGFAYRGTGYATSVRKEDWDQFRAYTERAFKALAIQTELAKDDPNWHWAMLAVGRLQSWPSDRYFDFARAALDKFPDYYDLYFEVAEKRLPQWGGSLEEVAQFAEDAVKRTHATEGRSLYARIYWSVYNYIGPNSLHADVDWSKIRVGFDDVVKRYPSAWNLNFYARMACDAGDKPTAKRLLTRIADNVDPSAWASRSAWRRCKNWTGS